MLSGVIFLNVKRLLESTGTFLFGGILYGAVETLWRGYTHPTMLLAGGLSFYVIYRIDGMNPRLRLWQRMASGSAVITLTELLFGVVFNLMLGLEVWDYSGYTFNLWGQICALYSLLWATISVPAFALCRIVRGAFGDISVYSASASESSSAASASSP